MYLPQKYHEHRDLKYKIVQAKLAEQLESKHSKNWILDQYLNDVPYGTTNGEEAVGVGAAVADVLQQAGVEAQPGADVAAGRAAPVAHRVQPDGQPDAGQAPTQRGAPGDGPVALHHPEAGQRGEKQPLRIHPNARFIDHSQPYIFDYIQQQLEKKFGLEHRSRHGGLKVYTTIDLKMQQQAEEAIHAHVGGAVLDAQPAAALASVDPSNGHILAIASSATYDQTKFDFPVQAERQTGSAFKVFALMTLIHDYDGDPNQTYYSSKFLPAGWNPLDPTWSVHTAEETYQGTINITKATTVSDNTVFAQLADDEGYGKLDATAHAMGITSTLDGFPSEVIGGLRYGCTTLEMADAYATLANGGNHVPATILSKVVFPNGKVVNLGDPPQTRVFTDGEAYEGDPGAEDRDPGRHRDRRQLRLPRRRQDGHRGEPGQRLVRRLHAQAVDRGLGRLPPGQHPDGFLRVRRDRGRADLARLHAARLGRLLRRLPDADHVLHGHLVHRPALVRQVTEPEFDSRAEPLQQPAALRPAADDQDQTAGAGSDHHGPVRWWRRGAAGTGGGGGGGGGGGHGGGHGKHG